MSDQSHTLVPWNAPSSTIIPANAEPGQILEYANALRPNELQTVAKLLENKDYSVAAEYVWRRGISKMRANLSNLGMKFVGEMLGRSDIDESSFPERALTEYDTIRLAEQLGFVSSTGAFRLQQAFDTLAHFSSEKADDIISTSEATNVLRGCIQYLLRTPETGMAMDFAMLRTRLLSETLPSDDPQLSQLLGSPPFFLGTTVRILLSGIKDEKGARVEHAIRNFYQILPPIWPRLPEPEKWNIGRTYAEVAVSGNTPAASGLKHALHLVSGFDYVPENLRSNSYKRAAQAVMDAHFGMNNFYTEAQPMQQLSSMGTSIPKPALAECLQALICVYVGNTYGHAWNASSIALTELKNVSVDRWDYYLNKVLFNDSSVLGELIEIKPAMRFSNLIKDLNLAKLANSKSPSFMLIDAASHGRVEIVRSQSQYLWNNLKGAQSA